MKELHIYLKWDSIFDSEFINYNDGVYLSLDGTLEALHNNKVKVYTPQPHVCSTTWLLKGYRIFVHMLDDKVVEIKLGECCGREIRISHNLEKMLLANVFGLATRDYEED